MSKDNDIEIPSYMNNTNNSRKTRRRLSPEERAQIIRYDFENTKNHSRDTKLIHAKKSKKKVSKMSEVKRMRIAFGLGVGVTLGVVGFANKDNIVEIPQKFEEWQITSEYLSDLYDVIHEHEHENSNGTWYDVGDISADFQDMLKNGVPEDAIAYVTANSFSYTYETDERSAVFSSLFNATPDEWAKQHGYDSIEDENLEKDVERNILRTTKINEYNQSLNSMLEDTGNQIESSMKGMGGK